jgi:uncharacterized protein YjaG (DUF416 family)
MSQRAWCLVALGRPSEGAEVYRAALDRRLLREDDLLPASSELSRLLADAEQRAQLAMIERFDELALVGRLESLSPALRAAFAGACAERMLPSYRRWSQSTGRGNVHHLSGTLARLWADILSGPMVEAVVDAEIEECMRLLHEVGDLTSVSEWPAAAHAVAAVAYALRCCQRGGAQDAAWTARHAYETLAAFVAHTDGIDLRAPGAEIAVVKHPLIQAELGRQSRDIEEVSTGGADTGLLVGRLHSRARAEAGTFLQLGEA